MVSITVTIITEKNKSLLILLMSVLLETTEGNIVIDLFIDEQPLACYNFLKLCKLNYYFFTPFYDLHKDLIVTSGDPNYPENTDGNAINSFGDVSINDISIKQNKYLSIPNTRHEYGDNGIGLVSFVTKKDLDGTKLVIGSQFTISLTTDVTSLKSFNQVYFGKVVEGFQVLEKINLSVVEDMETRRLLKDIRITHTHNIYDPFPDPSFIDKKKSTELPSDTQIANMRFTELNSTAKLEDSSTYQALALELMNDLPHYQIKPSPRTLFIAKLNPITTSESLSIIFNRFGNVINCNVVEDRKTNKSLCYGFVEFEDKQQADRAYSKLKDGCIIDGRNVVIDFSQSVKNMKLQR